MRTYGLTKYSDRVYSQNTEDGMIRECLESLGIDKGFFVDVGSWDGIYLSNVYHLALNRGFKGICIEGTKEKAEQLKQNMKNLDVACLDTFISLEPGNDIDTLLERNNCPKDFDLLSIDIDGNDWWIWNSLKKHSPKIVIIEYNANQNNCSTMPYDPTYVHHNTVYYGATPPALKLLADYKGYDLVGINHVNLVFVRKDVNNLRVIGLNEFAWYGPWADPDHRQMMEIRDLNHIDEINNKN